MSELKEKITADYDAKQYSQQTQTYSELKIASLPQVIWTWHFFGDYRGMSIHLAVEVSWWKRFWTRVFFGSTWTRIEK